MYQIVMNSGTTVHVGQVTAAVVVASVPPG